MLQSVDHQAHSRSGNSEMNMQMQQTDLFTGRREGTWPHETEVACLSATTIQSDVK